MQRAALPLCQGLSARDGYDGRPATRDGTDLSRGHSTALHGSVEVHVKARCGRVWSYKSKVGLARKKVLADGVCSKTKRVKSVTCGPRFILLLFSVSFCVS